MVTYFQICSKVICIPEVIVELKACGLCGTDISILRHGSSGDLLVTPENPFYLGHECSGMVASVGKDVDNLKVGE